VAEDERELVAQAGADPAAFAELYQRYVQPIYSYVYYRTGSVSDAEDLTARTFQRALARLPHYVDRGLPFSAWLYRIAHNLVANWYRDQARRRMVPLDDSVPSARAGDDPERAAETAEENRRLLRALRRLSPERQQVVILKFVEQLPNAEIGAIIGRSEGAVKSLYHRTLLALRAELSGEAGAAAGDGTTPTAEDRHAT
jgi:RNA polymerase sigma-70 factor (ECF subfamily)